MGSEAVKTCPDCGAPNGGHYFQCDSEHEKTDCKTLDLDALLAIDAKRTPGDWTNEKIDNLSGLDVNRAAIVSAVNSLRPLAERCRDAKQTVREQEQLIAAMQADGKDITERCKRAEAAEKEYRHKVIMEGACVAELTRQRNELQERIKKLEEPYMLGDINDQAHAWIAVWRVCESLGLLSHFDGQLKGGRYRVESFIKHLASQRNELLAACEAAVVQCVASDQKAAASILARSLAKVKGGADG